MKYFLNAPQYAAFLAERLITKNTAVLCGPIGESTADTRKRAARLFWKFRAEKARGV